MQRIVVPEEKELREKLERMRQKGKDSIHVLADFDGTLTYGVSGKEKLPSLISILREKDYLDKDYSRRAKELFNHYHPFEIDPALPKEEKRQKMGEWWRKHGELLAEKGMRKEHLERLVEDESIELRDGVESFIRELSEKRIPVIIFSASGCGEAVEMFFRKKGLDHGNVHFLVNRFKWSEEGKAMGFEVPLIHSMSKNELTVLDIDELRDTVGSRRNVILLGDSPSDVDMVEGFDHDTLLKIGFLNDMENEEKRRRYEELYDIVARGDERFDPIMKNFLSRVV